MNLSENASLICTIPRSGTNLLYYFFRYLALFLTEDSWTNAKSEQEVFSQVIHGYTYERGEGMPMIGHGYCPGFESHTSNCWYTKWSSIPNTDHWFNAVSQYGVAANTPYDPNFNADVKLVFVYRNPLDCILSLYDHLQEHKNFDQSQLSHEFLVASVLPQYIKSYVSFREMKSIFSNNILLISYESLISDRRKYLSETTSFLRFGKEPNFQDALSKALEFTEIDKMKALERSMNRTLADDQKIYDSSKSHIRSIDRSQERKNIPDAIVSSIKSMLQEYNITEFERTF